MLLCRTMPQQFTCADFYTSVEFGRKDPSLRLSSMRAAARDPRGGFSFDVQLVLLAVFCPCLFQRAGLVLRSDSESGHCQNQGTHTGGSSPVRLIDQVSTDVRRGATRC
jgi:hypothetical protein